MFDTHLGLGETLPSLNVLFSITSMERLSYNMRVDTSLDFKACHARQISRPLLRHRQKRLMLFTF